MERSAIECISDFDRTIRIGLRHSHDSLSVGKLPDKGGRTPAAGVIAPKYEATSPACQGKPRASGHRVIGDRAIECQRQESKAFAFEFRSSDGPMTRSRDFPSHQTNQ
jgi:hypothetical protein